MTAQDRQHGGDHYKRMSVEPWSVVDTWPLEQRIGFYRGNALKYVMRMSDKDAPADNIGKAAHYCEKLTEVLREADSEPELPLRDAISDPRIMIEPKCQTTVDAPPDAYCLVSTPDAFFTDNTPCIRCGPGPCTAGHTDPRIPTVICPVTEVNCGQACNPGECRKQRK